MGAAQRRLNGARLSDVATYLLVKKGRFETGLLRASAYGGTAKGRFLASATPAGVDIKLQGVLDSERFTLLRSLDFFASFGDVELWEVVHRAKWQRHDFGHALYRKGEEGNTFHIIAKGELEVFRDGQKVAQLGAGTSVGEMAYLAPSAELRRHSTDVIVTETATTISFTPETLAQNSKRSCGSSRSSRSSRSRAS